MTDLTKLSDADLKALSEGDMSSLSDEGLRLLAGSPMPAAESAPIASNNFDSSQIPPRDSLLMEGAAGLYRPYGNIPGLPEAPPPGTFAGDDLASRVVGTGAEFLSTGGPLSAATRMGALKAMKLLPEGKVANILNWISKGNVADDVLGSAASGAGLELLGEGFAGLWGEDARVVGEFIGSVVAPMTTAQLTTFVRAYDDEATKLLREATPSMDKLRTAQQGYYELLKHAGIRASVRDRNTFVGMLEDFSYNQQIPYLKPDTSLGVHMNKLFKAAEEGQLTYALLHDTSKALKAEFSGNGDDAARKAGLLVRKLDEFVYNMDVGPQAANILDRKTVKTVLNRANSITQRIKTSEAIETAMTRAASMSEGGEILGGTAYEKALAGELREMLNPNTSGQGAFMTEAQKNQIREVLGGNNLEKKLRAFAKLGVNSDDYIRAMLTGVAVGIGTGSMPAGAAVTGAMLVQTGIGMAARKRALTLFSQNVPLKRGIIQAGDNANQVVRTYMKHTPSGQRDAADLSRILIDGGYDLTDLSNSKLVRDSEWLTSVILMTNIGHRLMREERAEGPTGDIPAVPAGY